ncbi:uncharacterized protein G2W53_029541 [Senna tora]|uniref:Uncharacterized protein n=1 Tax=Senna tora TaxID=362788 RepID=A0A834WAT1_9FABA|nr:uncharacterized protein G2W53_029541 [Senna tora]
MAVCDNGQMRWRSEVKDELQEHE